MIGRVYLAIRKWLSGEFQCLKCGRTFYLLTFGYGKVICPDCYKGGNSFIFFEDPIMRIFNQKTDERRSRIEEEHRIHIETSMQVV